MSSSVSQRWRVSPGNAVDLGAIEPRATPGAPGDKAATVAASAALVTELAALQERLWAERRQSLLVVLQAIDTGGKDGAIRHLFGGLNAASCRVASFGVPTPDELAHDFLWRIHRHTPGVGEVVVFNRSHYEDVLVVRVHKLVEENVWRNRFRLINDFELNLDAARTRVVKLFLHISRQEQAERLQARIDDPAKRWKFRVGDLEERGFWDDYQAAFTDAIAETSTANAPWYVIPADRKWYRNWAATNILVDTLKSMDPQYPPGDDVAGIVVS